MIKFFNRCFATTVHKSIIQLRRTPIETKFEPSPLIDQSLMLKLSTTDPDYSAFYDEVSKLYPKTMETELFSSIQNYVAGWPLTAILNIFDMFDCGSASHESCESLLKLSISVPGLLKEGKILGVILDILRNKKINPGLFAEMKKAFENIGLNSRHLETLVFILRILNNNEDLKKIALFVEEMPTITLRRQIVLYFHINKGHALDESLKKSLLKRKNLFKYQEPDVINRLCDIYLTDKSVFYPEFLEFLKESIGYILKKANVRETMNLLNYIGHNFPYAENIVVNTIYKSLLDKKLVLNSMDIATLFHNLKKLSLPVLPFLPLLTKDLINSASGIETAVIFHSVYKYEGNEKLDLLKKNIMLKFDSLSPKLILNIAKDLVEDLSIFDKEYIEAFEKKAEEAFFKHWEPDTIHFRTQLITYYYLKFKNELKIESDLEED